MKWCADTARPRQATTRARWAGPGTTTGSRSDGRDAGDTPEPEAVRVRLLEALTKFPEAKEALRTALQAGGWLRDPGREP